MKGFVLDSYALMAFFEDEPGAKKVEELLTQRDDLDRCITKVRQWIDLSRPEQMTTEMKYYRKFFQG